MIIDSYNLSITCIHISNDKYKIRQHNYHKKSCKHTFSFGFNKIDLDIKACGCVKIGEFELLVSLYLAEHHDCLV